MATEEIKTEETTVRTIICRHLNERMEKDSEIMRFYENTVKERLMQIDETVFLIGENRIDILLTKDKEGREHLTALINEKILFENIEYQNPSKGFIAVSKLFDTEEGLIKVSPIERNEVEKLVKESIVTGFSFYSRA